MSAITNFLITAGGTALGYGAGKTLFGDDAKKSAPAARKRKPAAKAQSKSSKAPSARKTRQRKSNGQFAKKRGRKPAAKK